MICKNCGEENLDTGKFCKKCGTPLVKEEVKNNKKKIIIIAAIALVVVAAILCAILIPKGKKDKKENPTIATTERPTELETIVAPTENETTEKPTEEETTTKSNPEYLIEDFAIEGMEDTQYIKMVDNDRFLMKKDDKYGVVDSKGNVIIGFDYPSVYTYELEEYRVFFMYNEDKTYDIYNKDGSLLFRNKDFVDYLFSQISDDVIHFCKERTDYDDIGFGTVYDDVYIKVIDSNTYETIAKFSRDDIPDYVCSGSLYDGKVLVKMSGMTLINDINRVYSVMDLSGNMDWIRAKGYQCAIPAWIHNNRVSDMILVNVLSKDPNDGKYNARKELFYTYSRKFDEVIADSRLDLSDYMDGMDNAQFRVYTLGDCFVIYIHDKEETIKRYVIFDKWGEHRCCIDGEVFFTYDGDFWLVHQKNGKWGIIYKDGTFVIKDCYDASSFNGEFALVKKTEDSPFVAVQIERNDEGEFVTTECKCNAYEGEAASWAKENYFVIKNGDDTQLVKVSKVNN